MASESKPKANANGGGRGDRRTPQRIHHTFGSDERIFDPMQETIEDFLLTYKPSELSVRDGINWIRVLGPKYHETHGSQTCDVDELAASFQRLTHKQRLSTPPRHQGYVGNADEVELTQGDINSLDKELTSGKWMLFPTRECVDDIWFKIAKATATGKLGDGATMAKVSPVGDDGTESAYIAVYTPDYRNKTQVYEVEKKMRDIGVEGRLKYKSDINTKSGVYSRNGWKVKPSIYETGEPLNHRSNSRGRSRGRGGQRYTSSHAHSQPAVDKWSYRSRHSHNTYDDFD